MMEFVVKTLIDVQDVNGSQDHIVIAFGNHEIFKVDVHVAMSFW